ncbi:MAG: DUF4350 domain-containing protein [Deltaproteobacteria bacterium]|nr:DUF4350 domain-containing protein [Deltaproteobacteria bacterium]MBP6830805.1 DUF4350 domain-containing protein [Deltaproteobacteria bacterium]
MTALVLWFTPSWAWAIPDYDPQSRSWSGTSELVRIAAEAEVELRPSTTLDWGQMPRGGALLVLHPRNSLGLADVSAFLDDGGRVAWLDDFGASEEFWRWFQFRGEPVREGVPRTPELPELLVARPRMVHPLTVGVDALVTNLPVALAHPRLRPVFDFEGRGQGLLLVGQIHAGKLVVAGDPSVLINTMMRFPGNRQFARNLLSFLAAAPGGRVTMVWGDIRVRGQWQGRTRARTRRREAVNTLNTAFRSLSDALAAPSVLRPFAALLALAVACIVAALAWGRRPSERYGPRGPVGATAGVTERVAIFSARGANLLLPALLARSLLEGALLRAVGVKPPTDVRAVLDRLSTRLGSAQRDDIRAVLTELDVVARGVEDGERARVAPKTFVAIWRRVSGVLRGIESTR